MLLTRFATQFVAGTTLLICAPSLVRATDPSAAEPPFFSLILGSQWVGGFSSGQPVAAPFADREPLHEAYRIMQGIGSDIVKLSIAKKDLEKQGHDVSGVSSLADVVRHPHLEHVFALPFRVMLHWAHGGKQGWHTRRMTATEKESLYREFFELTRHLLTTYRGTGKTFLIGNWEGDWMAGGRAVGDHADLEPERIEAFGEWLDVRTAAIDAAKEATLRDTVFDTLNYVEQHLPQRDVPGKRVFIGEIGFTVDEIQRTQKLTAAQADREQARLALDLPPLNEATSGATIPGGRNQGGARDATRKAGAGGANHPEAPRRRGRAGVGGRPSPKR